MLVRLMEINSLCGSEEGVNVLKLNIRLQQTSPHINKLKEKVGKGG